VLNFLCRWHRGHAIDFNEIVAKAKAEITIRATANEQMPAFVKRFGTGKRAA
jgi:hypothetical protein